MSPRGFAYILICAILWLSISVDGQPDEVTVAFEISNIATVDLTTATFWLGTLTLSRIDHHDGASF